mgnify:CR=1 FL=1
MVTVISKEPDLRDVIRFDRWNAFVGEGDVPQQELPVVEPLDAVMIQYLRRHGIKRIGFLPPTLYALARTKQRVARRIREAAFPLPGDGWPSLPWPAF